jgi:hypothetical protein
MTDDNGLPPVGGALGSEPSDPSALSTAQLVREITHLRDLVEANLVGRRELIASQIGELHRRLDEADLRYQQRFDAQTHALDTAMAAAGRAVEAALAAAEKAVTKTELAAAKQFDEVAALAPRLQELAQQLVALDRLTDAKFITFRTLIDSQAEKVALALASVDKAVTKAETATERRFESVNEFRQTLTDQAATFATRDQFETQRSATTERIQELTARVDRTEGRSGGVASSWGYLVGAITIVVIVVNLFVYIAGGE